MILIRAGIMTVFARIVCVIESIQKYGVKLYRRITSLNNELYTIYNYVQGWEMRSA